MKYWLTTKICRRQTVSSAYPMQAVWRRQIVSSSLYHEVLGEEINSILFKFSRKRKLFAMISIRLLTTTLVFATVCFGCTKSDALKTTQPVQPPTDPVCNNPLLTKIAVVEGGNPYDILLDYDASGRLIRTSSTLGRVSTFEYLGDSIIKNVPGDSVRDVIKLNSQGRIASVRHSERNSGVDVWSQQDYYYLDTVLNSRINSYSAGNSVARDTTYFTWQNGYLIEENSPSGSDIIYHYDENAASAAGDYFWLSQFLNYGVQLYHTPKALYGSIYFGSSWTRFYYVYNSNGTLKSLGQEGFLGNVEYKYHYTCQ